MWCFDRDKEWKIRLEVQHIIIIVEHSIHVEHAVWLPPTERKRHNNEPLKSRLCGLSVSQHLIRFICHLFVVMTMRRLAGDKRETRRVFMVSLKATRETEIVVIRLLRYANHRRDIAVPVRSFKSLKITRDLRTIVLLLLVPCDWITKSYEFK